MFINKNYKNKINIITSIFLYLSLITGFLLNEDSLGGAINDYNYHLPIIFAFKKNILETLTIYGSNEMIARNSPLFYIIYGLIIRFFENLNLLRLINIHVILLIIFFFYKSLKIKFHYVRKEILYLISLTVFLSPTIRSLSIWPYPLVYAILFFTISIYFFLLFEDQKINHYKYAFWNTIFLGISSYFTPNFCVFSIFFFLKFLERYKLTSRIYLLILLNLIIAIPAFLFLVNKNFFLFNYEGTNISFLEKINIANKIVIISTIIFFHLFPFFFNSIRKILITRKEIFLIIIIYFFSIFFFNFPKQYNAGGGIIFHLSNLLTNNNFVLFIFFFFSLIYLSQLSKKSYYNYLLILLLIPYNLQFTIYHKYFDSVIFIIFMLLFSKQINLNYFKYKNILYLYIFQFIFLILSLNRNLIYGI